MLVYQCAECQKEYSSEHEKDECEQLHLVLAFHERHTAQIVQLGAIISNLNDCMRASAVLRIVSERKIAVEEATKQYFDVIKEVHREIKERYSNETAA